MNNFEYYTKDINKLSDLLQGISECGVCNDGIFSHSYKPDNVRCNDWSCDKCVKAWLLDAVDEKEGDTDCKQ